MRFVLSGLNIFFEGSFKKGDILIEDGVISALAESISRTSDTQFFDFSNKFVFPGFTDVHVHLREPGFSYKETVAAGTLAAARGGYTSVCAMPNLSPVPDCCGHLQKQTEIIMSDACIAVYPYGAITVGQKGERLSDMESIAEKTIAFSDDGRGVQHESVMRDAMLRAKKLGSIIAAHCEDESLLCGGYIHDGAYARKHGLPGISSQSEWKMIERDIALAKETGCAYHVCHISAKESVALIRNAKKDGVDITCETAPHYIVLCDEDIADEGRFKMNPPIRGKEDRDAIIKGLLDGTIDMIATDHAPHSAEEKSKGLKNSLNGIVGLETAFPVLYTELVKKGRLSLERLVLLMSENPKKRFSIGGGIKVGEKADFTVFDLEKSYTVDSSEFLSKGKSTPFEGVKVYGRCMLTYAGGNKVWEEKR